MYNPVLAQNMRFLKETVEGEQIMCEIMDELMRKEKLEIAKKLLRRGKYSYEEIAEDAGLPLETVLKLAQEQSA